MSLDVSLICESCQHEVFSRNITHNLTKMAAKADLYKVCWRPEEIGITKAKDAIPLLTAGLLALREAPSAFQTMNPENGWGSYENLVEFVEEYLTACQKNPECMIGVYK